MESMIASATPEATVAALDQDRQWYAVRVKPQHERTVSYTFRKKGFDRYVPLYKALRRWADSLKELDLPLFPGYVFCRLASLDVPAVLATPAVYQIVARGNVPAPIAEDELHILRRIESAGLPIAPWPYLKEGQKVRIARGPLTGVSGFLANSAKNWHVVVNMPLLQRGVGVTVAREDLAPMSMVAAAAGRGGM
jgi:transcription antitermination factor NusG